MAAHRLRSLLLWYEGADFSVPRYFHADNQGSIAAVSTSSGNKYVINTYDDYGTPGSGNVGQFQYTGQVYIPETGLFNYKARFYSLALGRFMQTDPVGYDDQVNLYAYVANDPVNKVDPGGEEGEDITITGRRISDAIVRIATTPLVPTLHFNLPKPVLSIAQVFGISEQCAQSTSIEDCSTSDKMSALLLLSLPRDVLALGKAGVTSFSVSAKHLLGAGGNFAKFATADRAAIRAFVSSALSHPESVSFQARSGNYVVMARLASAIGAKGETGIKVVLSPIGKVITAYPVR